MVNLTNGMPDPMARPQDKTRPSRAQTILRVALGAVLLAIILSLAFLPVRPLVLALPVLSVAFLALVAASLPRER